MNFNVGDKTNWEDVFLAVKDISISFGEVNVLRNMNMKIYKGKALGIVGENGAGKSTLVKIITGIYLPTSGSIFYKGDLVNITNIKDSKKKFKVAIVNQEQQLCEQLTVAQNIFLGAEIRNSGGLISNRIINEKAQKVLNNLGVNFSANTLVKDLTISQRQFVEIAKSLSQNPEIIIFDEPTSVLTQKDTDKLYKIVDDLKAKGVAIIWITHRMEEISRVCEEILVIKDGNYIIQQPFKKFKSIDEIIDLMVGRKLDDRYPPKILIEPEPNKNFKVQNLNSAFHHKVNFEINSGEIVVFYGLVGSGRTELAKIIIGTLDYISGDFYINNAQYLPKNPKKALQHKIFYLCEDRKQLGLNVNKNLEFNINIANYDASLNRLRMINHGKCKEFTNEYINKLSIKAHSWAQVVENLSGGNQQKVAIGKGLQTFPTLFIFDEPTRGVDVGARKDIYTIINELKKQNKMILVISSDLPEVIGIADRVITLFEGKITGNLSGKDINENTIIRHAFNIEEQK